MGFSSIAGFKFQIMNAKNVKFSKIPKFLYFFITVVFDEIMQTKNVAWVVSIAFIVVMLLYFLRLLNLIGNEYDLLVRWVSTISLMLTGVCVGILISEKRIPAKTALINLTVVIFGLALIPIVAGLSATLLNTLPLPVETKMIVTFILSVNCGLLYMGLFIRYRKRKYSSSWETD